MPDPAAPSAGLAVLILHANLAATWFMAGLIWLVQIVHYPQFDAVGEATWADYHRRHTANITFIVAPAMLVELTTAGALLAYRPAGVPAWAVWAGLVAVGLLWLSTALLQVPDHSRLAAGFDPAVHRRLVVTNWLRTALWTGRGLLMTWCALRVARVL